MGAKIWIKIRKPRDRFQEKLIKIRDPEKLVGSRPLKYYVTDNRIRYGTQYLDFEEYVSLHSM